jgi:hypothetical protein
MRGLKGLDEAINWNVPPEGMINPVLYQVAVTIHRFW